MAKKRIKNELSLVFGKAPSLELTDEALYNSVLGSALQWYGKYGGAPTIAGTRSLHREWLETWALANKFKAKNFSIPAHVFPTFGALAKIALEGFPLKKADVKRLKDLIKSYAPQKAKPVDREAIARQIKLRAKMKHEAVMTPVLTIFDNAIDSVMEGAKSWDVKTSEKLNNKQMWELTGLYKRDLKELKAAYDRKNDDMVEQYACPRLVLRRLVSIHEDILEEISEAGNRGAVLRKARKPRVKKVVPNSVHVKWLKFLPVHNEYGLVSVDPEELVEAQIAYVFDTRKRLLKKYTADGIDGMMIGGTTIKNAIAVQKMIRNPKDQLAGFAGFTKIRCKKEFDNIRAVEKGCSGRMNKDTIILKVIK